MGNYLPSTPKERGELLAALGLTSAEELYSQVPEAVRLQRLCLPDGQAELAVAASMRSLADQNRVFPTVLRGAGAYRHYIPSIVKSVASKEEFVTAYTPYQAEISQGLLQSIFEYQTMICSLTGMDAANASVYDGASAAAEAVGMCRAPGKRMKALVSSCAHPMTIETIRTYCFGSGMEVVLIPQRDGATDLGALAELADSATACVFVQQPNYFGVIEDAAEVAAAAHQAGAKCILSVYPTAAALLASAGECGADIACGEGQPLGLPMAFGGPHLGFLACTAQLMRKLPGRIVGETVDSAGRRAFVLTLQAREQHIRREKASSNICSNQALCALTASVYLSALGATGLRQVAEHCLAKAHYAAERFCEIPGFALAYGRPFFHEFATRSRAPSDALLAALEGAGILGGLPLDGNTILWCVTECVSRQEIDRAYEILKEVSRVWN